MVRIAVGHRDNKRVLPRLETLEERTVLDVGDTLALAMPTGMGPGLGLFSLPGEGLGDGKTGNRDVDLYSFDAAAGMTVLAASNLMEGGGNTDTVIRLFDANGRELAINDDHGGTRFAALQFTFTKDGTYYVGMSGYPNLDYDPQVEGSGVAGAAGSYRLDLMLVDAPVDASDDVGDALVEALDTGLVGEGYYTFRQYIGDGAHGPRDVDLFAFQAQAGGSLLVFSAAVPGGERADTMFRLFDGNGNPLLLDDDGGPDRYSWHSYTFPADGVYYLGISAYNNAAYDPNVPGSGEDGRDGTLGDYRLDLFLLPAGMFPGTGADAALVAALTRPTARSVPPSEPAAQEVARTGTPVEQQFTADDKAERGLLSERTGRPTPAAAAGWLAAELDRESRLFP